MVPAIRNIICPKSEFQFHIDCCVKMLDSDLGRKECIYLAYTLGHSPSLREVGSGPEQEQPQRKVADWPLSRRCSANIRRQQGLTCPEMVLLTVGCALPHQSEWFLQTWPQQRLVRQFLIEGPLYKGLYGSGFQPSLCCDPLMHVLTV